MITHGNGPQVGLLALEADAYKAVAPYPLDILGAESQGMIGYLLVQALASELPEREVVALLTQVLVDADDPAFTLADEADRPGLLGGGGTTARCGSAGWAVARDGKYFRRVVASPEPKGDRRARADRATRGRRRSRRLRAVAAGFPSSRTPEPCAASRR